MAPPPAPNDAQIFQPGLEIPPVWRGEQPWEAAWQPPGRGGRGSPQQRSQEAQAGGFLRAGFQNRYPGSPGGEKSDFPKPQSAREMPGREVPTCAGAPPCAAAGTGTCPRAPRRPGTRAARVGRGLVSRVGWASDEGGRVSERFG